MRVYVVVKITSFDLTRVGGFHSTVFHGRGDYQTLVEWRSESRPGINEKGERVVVTRPPDWRWPGVTNQNREPLHIARSGRVTPDVFGSSFVFLVVSSAARDALSSLPNIGFQQVILEQLVDLPMPALGDFSWWDQEAEKYDLEPVKLLRSLPHVSQFEKTVGPYYQLLPANFEDLVGTRRRWVEKDGYIQFLPAERNDDANRYSDIESMPVNFGTYNRRISPTKVKVSEKMLEEYPIVQEPHFLFREDAFAKIAPFLDLDYYAIAVLNVGK